MATNNDTNNARVPSEERACSQVTVFSAQAYDISFFNSELQRLKAPLVFKFVEASLTLDTVPLAQGSKAVCIFVNDTCNAAVLEELAHLGVDTIALRCAGYNNVDLAKALGLGMTVTHVPAYSPYAVAEHACALILALNRKIYRVYSRVREGNYSLERLPWGFDMHGRTVGVLGTGKIGECFVRIMKGFGCRVVAYDPYPKQELVTSGLIDEYVPTIEGVLGVADIVSLHLPLTPATYHMINHKRLDAMKPGAMLINTSRGALIDTKAVITALKSKHLGALGLDVYEEEGKHFFHDLSDVVIEDDVLTRLTTFPSVIVTPHQAFFTKEALEQIARCTITSVADLHNDDTKPPSNYILHNHQARPGFVVNETVSSKARAYSFTGRTHSYVEEELDAVPHCS